VVASSVRGAFDEEYRKPAADQGPSHDLRREEMLLDVPVRKKAHGCRRQEGDPQIQCKSVGWRGSTHLAQQSQQPSTVEPADGENGPQLDEDFERSFLACVELEPVTRDDQMSRARDGQELRESFHDSKQNGLEIEGDVHADIGERVVDGFNSEGGLRRPAP